MYFFTDANPPGLIVVTPSDHVDNTNNNSHRVAKVKSDEADFDIDFTDSPMSEAEPTGILRKYDVKLNQNCVHNKYI